MLMSDNIAKLIMRGSQLAAKSRPSPRRKGMRTLRTSGLEKARLGHQPGRNKQDHYQLSSLCSSHLTG